MKTDWTKILWIAAFSLIVIWVFSCCSPQRKIEKAVETLKKYDVLDDTCAANFPVRESIVIKDTVLYDTVTGEAVIIIDTIPCTDGKPVITEKKCPPHQVITKTEWKERTVWKENTARVSALQGQNKAYENRVSTLTAERDLAKQGRSKWRLRFFILLGIVLAYIALRFFTPFKL